MSIGRNNISTTKNWNTPPKYIKPILKFFGRVTLDPCSNDESLIDATTCYSLPNFDGLKESWKYPTIYVNPPYGYDKKRKTHISDWLKKCAESYTQYENEILALIPVATNTTHWKKYVFRKATALCFLADTRLRFLINGNINNKGSPMACALVYWGNRVNQFFEIFKYGFCVSLTDKMRVEAKERNQQ